MQSVWVMGTRRCAHAVFILYGFLFERVLLTGLLAASPFPGRAARPDLVQVAPGVSEQECCSFVTPRFPLRLSP